MGQDCERCYLSCADLRVNPVRRGKIIGLSGTWREAHPGGEQWVRTKEAILDIALDCVENKNRSLERQKRGFGRDSPLQFGISKGSIGVKRNIHFSGQDSPQN